MSALITAGVAKGLENVSQQMATYDEREARRKSAVAQQQLAEQKLQDYQAAAPVRQSEQDLRMAQLQQQTYQANASNLQTQTFKAFELYDADSDARHLNNFLSQAKQNPVGRNIYGTTARLDNLAKSSETDQLLRQAGYQDLDAVYGDPELSKDLVLATMNDGTRKLVDINQYHAMSGYNKFLSNEQLAKKEREARINQMMRSGQKYSTVAQRERVVEALMQDQGLTRAEAYQQVLDMEQGSRTSGEMQAIQAIADEENLSILDAMDAYYERKGKGGYKSDKEQFVERYLAENPESTPMQAEQAYAARTPTATQKEAGDIEALKDSLDEMKFFDSNIGEMSMTDRAKVGRYINQIEDLRGVKLSTEDKRMARDFKSLINLGGTVSEKLTPDETGILDSFLRGMKSYLVNEVGGKEATSAYETFRSVLRNDLYGATLPAGEMKAFNTAAGTLAQKFKPALKAFQTQLKDVKSKMESIRDTNDPYLAHYYFGSDVDQLDEVIRQIEERLDSVQMVVTAQAPSKVITAEATPVPDGAPKKSLDEIFAEVKK